MIQPHFRVPDDNRENVGKQRAEMTAAASVSEFMTEAHVHFKAFDLDYG